MSNTFYTASTLWKGPYDTEEVIYYSGITQKVYENLVLENSFDPDYPENTAFFLVGTSDNDYRRKYDVFSSDNLVITNIADTVEYGIDDDKNLVIFPENYPLNSTDLSIINCKLIKNYASIFKANLVSFEYQNDFSTLKEKAISSMVSSDDGIYLAGLSGKIWFYDGNVIKGPIFEVKADINNNLVNIPSSFLLKHRFSHESEDYIYVSTDKYLKLYRSKLSTAKDGTDWEQICKISPFIGTTSGGVLSMTSAFDKIFLGCRNNKIYVYQREKDVVLSDPIDPYTLEIVETDTSPETLTEHILYTSDIVDFEPSKFDISCMESMQNQVLIGLSNKSEIWSYTELEKSNPESDESWVNFHFDEVFKNDPAPAQYYSYNSKTLSRNDKNLAIARNYNFNSNQYYDESLVISGITTSGIGLTVNGLRYFEFSNGSDWEQVLASALPEQDFYQISCASTKEIISLNNIETIDGYDLQNSDLVILKDQSTSTIPNGIYRYQYGSLYEYNNLNVENNTTLMGFYINNGTINGKDRLFISFEDYNNSNFNFFKHKHTVEFDIRNLAYSQAIGCTNLPDCRYLNLLLDNDEKLNSSTGYTGYQGFEVSDLYGNYSVEINNSSLKVVSGTKSIVQDFQTSGLLKNWRFSSQSSLAATTDNWQISNFVSSMIGTTASTTDYNNNSYIKYLLRIEPSSFGNPSIEIENLNISVTPDTVVKLRIKCTPLLNISLDDAYLRLYWTYNSYEFEKFSSVKLQTNDDYVEYTISPVWKDKIQKIKIEFYNLPESTFRPSYIYIDYIKIINENRLFDPNSHFSKIRTTVEGRDLKVWLGKQNFPVIYQKNFIDTDNFNPKYIDDTLLIENYTKPYIRFGKINSESGPSLFAYKKLSFYSGDALKPITSEVKGLSLMQNLPSTGGVRLISYHDGTLYCATDGFDSNNVSVNPDDRQSKIFYYNPDTESWINEDLSFSRKQIFKTDGTYDLLGIVRPINMISYKGQLFLSGQYANIKVI